MSPTLLKYLHKHTGMTKTFFGGDIVNDEATDYDSMEYLWEWRKQLKDLPHHHSVPGNHDDGNSTNNLFSEQYVYGYLLAAEETPDIVLGDNGMYYYIDAPAEKTRYLCLDTGYKDISSLSNEQSEFIKSSLLSTPDGWHVVVVAHIWYMPDYNHYNERPVPLTGLSATASSVATILDNYNARAGEFSACKAKVELCVGGHIHYDYVNKTNGGIPIICCETDSSHIRGSYTYSAGTTAESAVSGIVVDYTNNSATVVRVGRGVSFVVNLDNPTSEVFYTIATNLTNVTSSSLVSQIAEGAAYSTVLTATVGEMKSVVVTMGDKDVTSSVYNSSTGAITISAVTGNVVITAVAEQAAPTYTNVLDEVGYKKGVYLSNGNEGTDADAYTTGFILCPFGSTVRFKNVSIPDESSHGNRMSVYDENKEWVDGTCFSIRSSMTDGMNPVFDSNGNLVQVTMPFTNQAYVRFSAWNIDETSIITVNEPIE
jgi:hypothetical protein